LTPDRALVYSILKNGIPGYNAAKRKGIQADDIKGEQDQAVFKLIEKFIPTGRMPSYEEIALFAHVILPPNDALLDSAMCADAIATRTLKTQLNDTIGQIGQKILVDPYKARTELQELLLKTNRADGRISSSNDPIVVEELEQRYLQAESKPEGMLGLSSPWQSLDRASLGLQNGELHVLFAKRKVGKTFGALAWFEHIWTHDIKSGEKALIISMEMPRWQIYRRLFAIKEKLNYELFRSGRLQPEQRERFFAYCNAMKTADSNRSEIIVAAADSVKTVADIVALAAQHRPRFVLVDAFYILGKDAKKPKWERTLENAESLKLDLCTMDIPVLATTQLSGSVGKQELDADTDAAAFAKGIGDYADASYGLFCDETMKADEQRIFRVMDAREFVPINLLINFSQSRQDYSEIKVLDEDGDINPAPAANTGGPRKKLEDLPDFEEGDQLKFGDDE